MTYWHCRHRFCGQCGSPTRSAEGGCLRVCTNSQCGQQHFPRTDPAIIVLVTRQERCLLVRKSWWPEGLYSNVSGFVEPAESLEDTVVREVWEETGVQVEAMSYHSSQPWPFPSALMLAFTATAADGAIRIDEDELEGARWFSREETLGQLKQGVLKLPMRTAVSFRLIEDWFDMGDLGPLRSISG
jgi:NAD+ diphosphatase